jgi:hypothetical protein
VSCSTTSSAGQRHEGVRALEHDALALVHVAGDDQLLCVGERTLAAGQEFGDDAGHPAALGERRRRDRAHQPDRTSAIDKADVVLGEDAAEGMRRLGEARIGPGTGTAIDADITNRAHSFTVALQWKARKGRGVAG